MLTLRQYQTEIIQRIRNEFIKGITRLIMQLPTGGGKTVIFSYMIKTASERGNKCLILTDRIELLEQAGGTFQKIGLQYQNITADTKAIPVAKVLIAMVETIKRRCKARLDFQMLLKSIDMLIIDECHKASFDNIFQYLKPKCYVIGATATPIRASSTKPLKNYFDSIVIGTSINDLISQGFLSKPQYYGVPVDLSGIHLRAGDFDEAEMTKLYGERKIFEGLKENLSKHAAGKKTMIFCPSVASSLQVASELGCLHVDGTMQPNERDKVLTEFENTSGSVITNCAITTTGYDCPTIECIVLYRATTSLPLYLQMIGRGSRVTETKKRFVILDFGMNVQRFGFWHIDRVWSLDPPKKKSKKKDVFPIKFCPSCGAILAVNVKMCEFCGYIYPVTEKERIFIELEKLSYAETQAAIAKASTVEEMENIRLAKGYKIGYILHKFKDFSQFKEYEQFKGYKKGWAEIQAKNYLRM
jgi:superfamily II DNA or RNA helicase